LLLNFRQLSGTSAKLIVFVRDPPEVGRQLVPFLPKAAHLLMKRAVAGA
jgi:hypothetical protein